MNCTSDDLDIPPFLKRKIDQSPAGKQDQDMPPSQAASINLPKKRHKSTLANKDRWAQNIIAAVEKGADTFGKIRKSLPDLTEDQLKTGIRHAKRHWQTQIIRSGPRGRPRHTRINRRLDLNGRRYQVITSS